MRYLIHCCQVTIVKARMVFFYNPDFNKRFIEEMCRNVGVFHAATYCELQPRFNQQRSGVVFIHDKNKFFFFQKERGSKLEFSDEKGKIESFYDIVALLKNDFIKRGDSLKKVFKNKDLSDAPFLRVTQINDSSGNRTCQSFIFPYVPEH